MQQAFLLSFINIGPVATAKMSFEEKCEQTDDGPSHELK